MKTMRTPKKIRKLTYMGSCVTMNQQILLRYMSGTSRANGALIRGFIRKYTPNLANELALNFYNPYESQSRKKNGVFIYVHSAIEYVFKYE